VRARARVRMYANVSSGRETPTDDADNVQKVMYSPHFQ